MSAKSAKAASSDTKSKTKENLVNLEKILYEKYAEKEQLRYYGTKLYNLASSHDVSRREISTKNGLRIVLHAIEVCGDSTTCLSLIRAINEVAANEEVKRLVSKDITRSLLHIFSCFGAHYRDSKVLNALIALAVRISHKDRRFSLRARLSGCLPVLLSIVRSSTRGKLFSNSLTTLKLCAANSVNASILGRSGAILVYQRLALSLGRKNSSLTKTTLQTLSLLVKSSKANSVRAVNCGVVANMLSLHQEYHKQDAQNHRNILIRKSILNILKHCTNCKCGRQMFCELDGVCTLHTTCKELLELSCSKPVEALIVINILILRRCQTKTCIPVRTSQCSFQQKLTHVATLKSISNLNDILRYDEVSGLEGSDDDDVMSEREEQDFIASNFDRMSVESDNVRQRPKSASTGKSLSHPSSIASNNDMASLACSRTFDDLKLNYEKFFPELVDFPMPDMSRSTQLLCPCSSMGFNIPTHPPSLTSSLSDGYLLSRSGNRDIMKTTIDPFTIADFGEELMSKGNINNNNNYDDNYCQHTEQDNSDHFNLMQSLSKSTRSIKLVDNVVAHPDLHGHNPPSFAEFQCKKNINIQRKKMLEDISRTLNSKDIINKPVYLRDTCSLDFPSTVQQHDTAEINADLHLKDDGANNDDLNLMPDDYDSARTLVNEHDLQDFFNDSENNNSCPLQYSNGDSEPQKDNIQVSFKELLFDSDFECGNLRTAVQVREYEYDLVLDSDCNSLHYHQWFYFRVSGMVAGTTYRFNIINCEKNNSQFNFGMQPLMYSLTEARLNKGSWKRVGRDVCYYKNHFTRTPLSSGGTKNRTFFTATFSVMFPFSEDICYFAYHYPYTYTQLQADLLQLEQSVSDDTDIYLRMQTLCTTLSGNPVPVITITAPPDMNEYGNDGEAAKEFRSRPYIFLSSRVHPGESNSSWVMRGTLRYLATPEASELRQKYIFKIVPMLNPDGVINGHHRCSLTGEDLNRQWLSPDEDTFPTIFHTKGLLQYLHAINKAPFVYCDYHGHSRKKNVFLYGCSRKESVLAGESGAAHGGPNEIGCKTLPRMLNHRAPSFSYSNCSFVVESNKEGTARVVVWKEFGVTRSYTMESTYCGCDQGPYKNMQIGTVELEEMGACFCRCLLQLKSREKALNAPNYDDQDTDSDSETSEQLSNTACELATLDTGSVMSESSQDEDEAIAAFESMFLADNDDMTLDNPIFD